MSATQEPVDVFVASTPLQLISCAEARARYESGSKSVLIMARPDNLVTEKQMEYLIDHLGWKGAEILFLKKSTFYLRLGFVFRHLRRLNVSRLFIGNKSSWIHEVFYLGLLWDELIFVDDGLATVKYYHALHGEGLVSRISWKKRHFLSLLGVPLHGRTRESAAFFTCFPLASTDRVKVETHDFLVFRRSFKSPIAKKEGAPLVGFLGQPFGGKERLKQLKRQVRHVVERHPESYIVYFMHRKEDRKALVEALKEYPVEIREAGNPIEVEVALSGASYIAFYSFISTALYTLKKIFPEMRVFQIDDPAMGQQVAYYNEIVRMLSDAGVETTFL